MGSGLAMSLLVEIGAGTARALARRVRRVRVRVERMLGFGWLVGGYGVLCGRRFETGVREWVGVDEFLSLGDRCGCLYR